jgi:cytochrome c553
MIMRKISKISLLWVVGSFAFLAQPALCDEGETIYQQQCAACHQATGGGNEMMKAPSIAGLSQDYLQRQLQYFRDGIRGNQAADVQGQMMRSASASLTDKMIDALSVYVAALPAVEIYNTKESTGFRGRGLYSGCASCHGAKGEGYPELGAPRISHQYRWYLRSQIDSFRNALRGTHADDERGQQMKAMADSIQADEDIEVLVKHISGLGIK